MQFNIDFPVRLIQMVEGHMIRSEFQPENVLPAMAIRGFEPVRPFSRPGVRAELQGAPVFEGLCGPMWDGDAIRYEDRASNDAISL
jgi:hypothetical protein